MLSYQDIKSWLEKNKDKIAVAVCFVLVFIVGFGSGRYERELARQKLQVNYTTNYSKNPKKTTTTEGERTVGTTTVAQVAGTSTSASCLIKGNISAAGKKIYHMPGGAFYKIVKPEQCFATEQQAQAAGFVKSSR